ncbi:MAG: hypothetical protein ACJ8F7_23460, partial [Gemmataceae bacterium]
MTWHRLPRLAVFAATLLSGFAASRASAQYGVQWIWAEDSAPGATRYFRREFSLPRPPQEGALDITADAEFKVWVNGQEVGSGKDWKRVYRFDIAKQLQEKQNVVAVEVKGGADAAGLLVRLSFIPKRMSQSTVFSDAAWRVRATPEDGWLKPNFIGFGWKSVRVIGGYNRAPKWTGQTWDAGGDDRFITPPGFRVEEAVKIPAGDPKFSLVNMCFDAKGRLLVSREGKPVQICTDPDKDGVLQNVRDYCTLVKNCHGMCWIDDALYLTGDGPAGTGIYRVEDDGKKATALHLFPKVQVPNYGTQGGMGEHGPHALIHGPDDALYLVMGNHSWANAPSLTANSPLKRWPHGLMGPDQGNPNTTEDVLLPRLNDGRGHASNILAPGGTIWRMDKDAKNWSLVSAGYRNHFDAAFSPAGELFTFDSDMEWDEGLPWYRAVRIVHSPPGSDFLWRTGTANTPDYYLDSLPPIAETGRGSPVGVDFYDHFAFPKTYRGAFFMGDWSLGIIWAVHLERNGASWKPSVEKFCTGTPLNVTDLAVGPDGAIYFTMGGRNTQGGVYRIVATKTEEPSSFAEMMMRATPQPLAPWGRKNKIVAGSGSANAIKAVLLTASETPEMRHWAMKLAKIHGLLSSREMLALTKDADPEIRGDAVWLLGLHGSKREAAEARLKAIREQLQGLKGEIASVNDSEILAKLTAEVDAAFRQTQSTLLAGLNDGDPLVRRKSCEALIRADVNVPPHLVWRMLGDGDRFVQTAARLVLQRIDPALWAAHISEEPSDRIAEQAIVALCKTNQAGPYSGDIYTRLRTCKPADAQALLDWMRTLQLALVHAPASGNDVRAMARRCEDLFPQPGSSGPRANRELAILLTHFQMTGLASMPVQPLLMKALADSTGDKQQQMHYFLCMRLLKDGWTEPQKDTLLAWVETARDWTGGFSMQPFIDKMMLDLNPVFTAADRARVMEHADQLPRVTANLLKMATPAQLPPAGSLATAYEKFLSVKSPQGAEARAAVVDALGRLTGPDVQVALRRIGDKDPAQRDTVARGLARFPTKENFPYLLRGLESPNPLVVFDSVDALTKDPAAPKAEDAAPWRALILASNSLQLNQRWKAVELLRHWSGGRQFGAEAGDWKGELGAWSKWFAQAFPKEPALPNVATDKPAASKYRYEDLLKFVEKDPSGQKGDAARGRLVFAKAQCAKCHKYGTDGEGLGPDLSTLAKRFKRADVLESIYFPSKV